LQGIEKKFTKSGQGIQDIQPRLPTVWQLERTASYVGLKISLTGLH